MATNEPLLESRALALASAGRVSSEESGVSTVDGGCGSFHSASGGAPSGSRLMIGLEADFIGAIREVKYGWGVAPFWATLQPIHLISAAILDRLAKIV